MEIEILLTEYMMRYPQEIDKIDAQLKKLEAQLKDTKKKINCLKDEKYLLNKKLDAMINGQGKIEILRQKRKVIS